MNLFDKSILQQTLNEIASPITMNEDLETKYSILGFITDAGHNNTSTFHLHSVERFKCGDYCKVDDKTYLVVSDVASKRGAKYKATIEHCNYSIDKYELEEVLIGYDNLDRPVYDEELVLVGQTHVVLQLSKSTIIVNEAYNQTAQHYTMLIGNAASNKNDFTINNEITIYDRAYRVVNVDYSRAGLIEVKLESL